VNELLIGLIGALVATNRPLAVSNLIQQNIGVSVTMANPSDPAEQELQKLMAEDDAAQAEVDKWIRDNNAFASQGAGESKADLNKRILARFDSVRKNYDDFLRRHPDNARGHLAYGSFLNDIGDEESAMRQNETARQIDPKNPAAWNNLANYFGEYGPVTNAFAYYAEAIKLNPSEPVYYQNLATTVYLFRKDAEEFYSINEQQVFDKALEFYRTAVRLDPDNFPLLTDYAQSYYGIRPLRTNDALMAWTNALQIAHDDVEREGVYIHLARIKIATGRFGEARAQLEAVTNSMYADLKARLERNLAEQENATTNPTVAKISVAITNPSATVEIAPTNAENLSTNISIAQAMGTAVSNIIASLPTNNEVAPTNISIAATNEIVVSTNVVVAPTNGVEISTNLSVAPTNAIVPANALSVATNEAPALTNPPPFSTNIVPALTNAPPNPPKPLQLQMPPPVLRPLPETHFTNAP
jgi:tetratricopeptide (TPR) repeat protein